MKPTTEQAIELAREAGVLACGHSFDPDEVASAERLVHLALERFGAGSGEPTGYLVGHSGEYHYFRHKVDADREKAEQERCSGESCGDVEPVFRHPSLTDMRVEYLRGLEDAAKVCEYVATLYSEAARKHPEDSESRSRTFARSRAASQCVEEIRALLKGKQ